MLQCSRSYGVLNECAQNGRHYVHILNPVIFLILVLCSTKWVICSYKLCTSTYHTEIDASWIRNENLFTIAIRSHQQHYSSVRRIQCGFVYQIKTYQSKEIIWFVCGVPGSLFGESKKVGMKKQRLKITVYFIGFTTKFKFQFNKLQSMFVCSKINKIKNNNKFKQNWGCKSNAGALFWFLAHK